MALRLTTGRVVSLGPVMVRLAGDDDVVDDDDPTASLNHEAGVAPPGLAVDQQVIVAVQGRQLMVLTGL